MSAHVKGAWLLTSEEQARRRRDHVLRWPERAIGRDPAVNMAEVDAVLAKPEYKLSIPDTPQKPPSVVNRLSYNKLDRLWQITGPAAYKRVQKFGYDEGALEKYGRSQLVS
jgi:hypothetical protein